ncbi:MAG: sensor histidine kinase, partial [Limisphaerales bacterium]
LLYHTDLERVRTERRLAAQHNATRILAEASALNAAIPELLQAACYALQWQVGALWTFDRPTAQLRCAHLWHTREISESEFVLQSRTRALSPGDGLPGQVWAQARPLWIADVQEDSRLSRSAAATKAGLHAAFGLPVWSSHEMFGVLEFFSRSVEPQDAALLEMMGIVAAQIGLFNERTRAEERLRETTTNLQRSNAELQQFARVASHDLFEPLRMITSYLQLLQQYYHSNLDKRAHEFIGFALDGARRMDALIRDLLAYSRLEVRGEALGSVESEHVLDAALANLKIAIEEAQAIITRGQLPRVRADSLQLTQVFQNLIGNAIKFRGADPPRIEVAAHCRNGEWLFLVRDNGIGIDPKFFNTVFVIFQRLHTRQEYGGTGMGLAISKKIIERHGGRIWVESEPGKGSTFFFTLPGSGDGEG